MKTLLLILISIFYSATLFAQDSSPFQGTQDGSSFPGSSSPGSSDEQSSGPKPGIVRPFVAADHQGPGRVGLRLEFLKSGYPRVAALIPGGPADEAGLKVGDVIVQIDRNSTLAMNQEQIRDSLHGKSGTGVEVMVMRNDDPLPIVVALKREILAPDQIASFSPILPGVYYQPYSKETPTPLY